MKTAALLLTHSLRSVMYCLQKMTSDLRDWPFLETRLVWSTALGRPTLERWREEEEEEEEGEEENNSDLSPFIHRYLLVSKEGKREREREKEGGR